MNFKIPWENASRLLWTILSISKNDDDVLLSAVSRKAYYATAWFFSSHFLRKRTRRTRYLVIVAVVVIKRAQEESLRGRYVGIAIAAQSPVLSPLACRCRRAAAVLMCSLQILQFFMRHTRVQDIRRVANLIFNQKGKKYVFLRRLCLVKWPWPEGPSVSFIHIFLSAFYMYVLKKNRKTLVQSKTQSMPLVNFINSSVFFVLS